MIKDKARKIGAHHEGFMDHVKEFELDSENKETSESL